MLDEIIKTEIEPLLPKGIEKTLGKKYEEWTPEDFQLGQAIFGNKLEDFIAKKEVPAMYEAEKEALGG